MEESISKLRRGLNSFCHHLESSCDALKQSVERRPIPLDSASSTFIKCLNRRLSSFGTDLNLLDSMTFGTVSFEELLGHCNEFHKKNQFDLLVLEDHLKNLGHLPDSGIDDEDEVSMPLYYEGEGFDLEDEMYASSISYAGEVMISLEDDHLMDEPSCLKKLGVSDVCLANLASEANAKFDDPDISLPETVKYNSNKIHKTSNAYQLTAKSLSIIADPGKMKDDAEPIEAALRPSVKASKDDYENLPAFMKSLSSWEDLFAAVEKINQSLDDKDEVKRKNYFLQDEIASMNLGPKCRAYLLLLVRMNRLVVETVDGLIAYRVL